MGFQQFPYVAFAETDLELEGRRKATSLAEGVARRGARCVLTAHKRFKLVEADTEAAEETREAMIWRQGKA